MNALSQIYIQDCERLLKDKEFARELALETIADMGEVTRIEDVLFTGDFNPRKGKVKDRYYYHENWSHPSVLMFRRLGLVIEPL